MKRLLWRWVAKGILGDILSLLGPLLRRREKVLGLRNPMFMKHMTSEQAGGLCLSEFENHMSLGSSFDKLIRFDPDQFEDDVSYLFDQLIRPTDIVLDVGANNGFHTLLFAKRAHEGHVFAFEPVPKFAEQASTNCALNRVENVTIVNYALGDRDDTLEMKVNVGGMGLQGTSTFIDGNQNVEDNPDCYTVEKMRVRRMDDVIPQLGIDAPINFIKIDTEGFDTMVIEGGMETIKKDKPILFVEAHSTRLQQAGKSWSWYLETFPEYHILIIYPLTRAKPYLHLEPLTADLPTISVNLLMVPKISVAEIDD